MTGLTEIKTATSPQSATRISANINNALNVLGYVLSLTTSYLGGVAGWFGGASNAELSSKYQTLITPASVYFGYIWGLIFLFQGFFAAAQVLPKYRDHPLVQKGINVFYFIACIAQASWTVCFGYELMIPAFASMVVLLLSLLTILRMQWSVTLEIERKLRRDTATVPGSIASNEADDEELLAQCPRLPYWLLRFPFAVHAGWITPATLLMLSVLLVSMNVDVAIELWAAILGVAMTFGICMGLLLRQDSGAPTYVFPGTVAYASVSFQLLC